jgi:hypothetical protein
MSKRKEKPSKPQTAPPEHPRAWGSVLWDHEKEVLAMRRARKTWKEIAEHLDQQHGVKLTYRTIRNFFDRYSKRLKEKNFPIGYGPEPNPPSAPSPALAPPASAPAPIPPSDTAKKPGDLAREDYLKNQAQYLKEKAQRIQNEPPFYIHRPDES